MKKSISLIMLAVAAIFATGCNNSNNEEESQFLPFPLSVSNPTLRVGYSQRYASTQISEASSEYSFIYPKEIEVNNVKVKYSESIIKLRTGLYQNNSGGWYNTAYLSAEYGLDTDEEVLGYFILKDRWGQKRVIRVESLKPHMGILGKPVFDEQKLLNDRDYWQAIN